MTSMQECFLSMEHGVPGELGHASSCCKSLFLPPQLMDFKEFLESKSAPHPSADDRNFLCFQGSISSRKVIFPG